jgi:hypothetical protein
MIAIRTILCPVDFSPATPRQVDLAANLCLAFNARLVLLLANHIGDLDVLSACIAAARERVLRARVPEE